MLTKAEKALNFRVEDMNSKRVSVDGNVLRQKALNEGFQKEKGNGRGNEAFYSKQTMAAYV